MSMQPRPLPRTRSTRLDGSLVRRRSTRAPRGHLLLTCHQVNAPYVTDLLHHLGLEERVTLFPYQTDHPVSIVEAALREADRHGPFQRIYVLVTYDGREMIDWQRVQATVLHHTSTGGCVCRLVTSTPSFYVWILLHWAQSTLDQQGDHDVRTWLHDQLKASPPELMTHTAPLWTNLPDAIRRSQRLFRMDQTRFPFRIYTEMHEFVLYLLKWSTRLNRLL